MKIRLARHAGFCMGVKKALELVLKEVQEANGPVYTYGPIIHNDQVLEVLGQKGVSVLRDPDQGVQGRVVIRAHGAPPSAREALEAKGFSVVDGTCPKVRWVQGLARKYSKEDRDVVILGEPEHPEVIGIVAHGLGRPRVIEDPSEVKDLPPLKDPVLVAQTTQERERLSEVQERLKARYPQLKCFDTICNATKERQEEVRELGQRSDVIIIVGGKQSGNTKRLFEVAKATGKRAYLIETDQDIEPSWFRHTDVVSVTAGASTPNWVIIKVLRRLEEIKKRHESFLLRIIKTALRFSFFTGILAALAVFSFTSGIITLEGNLREFRLPTISALLFLSLLIMARYVDRESLSYNDPNMYHFLIRFSKGVFVFGVFCFVVGVLMTLRYLSLEAALVAFGLLFGVLGYRFQKRFKMSGIFTMPGTRTLGEAFIFAVLTGPFVNAGYWLADIWHSLLPLFLCISCGLMRSLLQDVLHFQGDLIVGEKSLCVRYGDDKVKKWISWLCVIQVAILGSFIVTGLTSSLPIALGIFFFCLCLLLYEKRYILIPSRVEIFSELSLILISTFVYIYDFVINSLVWHW